MSDHSTNAQDNLARMTKAELTQAVRALQAIAAQSTHALEQQAHLLDLSYDAIFVWELHGRIRYWNRAAAELYGWTREEALGRVSNELLKTIHPVGWPEVETTLCQEGHWHGELLHQTRDGRLLVVDSRHVLVRDENGQLLVLETNRDQTARKQAEEALQKSEGLKQAILASLTAHIAVLDRAGNIIDTNEAWERFARENCGARLATAQNTCDLTVCCQASERAPDSDHTAWAGIQAVLDGKQASFIHEYSCHLPQAERWFLMTVSPLKNEQGGAVVAHTDITTRKQAEQALHKSEDRLSGIINSAMDAIISVDEQQKIVLFNRAAEQMFGYTATQMLGQPLSRLLPERFREMHASHIQRFGITGETTRAMGGLNAICGLRQNNEEFPIEASISQIETQGQKLFTVILRDITERVRASERLVEQAALLNQSHEAIVVCDLDGRIRYWSNGAQRLYGWSAEETVGRVARDVLNSGDTARLLDATQRTIEAGEWNGELRQLTKDGREVVVEGRWSLVRDAAGNAKSILAINTDITEKKRLEANFLRAQRLESIGTLASGIAHDLNNVLSPISMGAQMLQMKLHDEQSQRLLALMQSNANRGAEMIKQVLSFARGISGQRVVLQPKHLIREVIRIAEETFPKSIRIEQRLPTDLWTINGDATQLHQVLLNLCVNARDAMPQGGRLTITAENQPLDELYARMLKKDGAGSGNFVVITITDSGAGIPPAIIDRIFDPFFTTKEPGKGTGLGLATTQSIVTAHGGFITVESQPGAGAKFTVYLPALQLDDQQRAGIASHEMPRGAGELILVVDDETAVREMTSAALEAFGYRALTADNGATALSVFALHQHDIQLVITDLMMPVVDGIATIRALHKLNPDIRIIATSGLADPAKVEELQELRVNHLLHKPYDAETLLQMLAQILQTS